MAAQFQNYLSRVYCMKSLQGQQIAIFYFWVYCFIIILLFFLSPESRNFFYLSLLSFLMWYIAAFSSGTFCRTVKLLTVFFLSDFVLFCTLKFVVHWGSFSQFLLFCFSCNLYICAIHCNRYSLYFVKLEINFCEH
jgi:hypothetical protein